MTYTPLTLTNGVTPWNAANAGHFQDGIIDLDERLSGLMVNVMDYGAVADGDAGSPTDNTTAFTNAAATGKVVYVPEGSYYGAWNLDPTNPMFVGPHNGTTKIVIATGNYFIDGNRQWDQLLLQNIDFVNGAGAVRNRYTSSNVTWLHWVTNCRFRNYTVCALSHNSSDFPFWKIHRCSFRAINDTAAMGIALTGLTDLVSIVDCEFQRNKIHIKLGNGGNNAKIQNNDFVQYTAAVGGNLRAAVWVVPRTSSTNAGPGLNISNNKFGNENLGADDKRILYADEAAGTYFGDKLPTVAADSTGFIIGHTVTDNLYNGGTIPIVYSTTPNIRGSSFDGKMAGGSPTYIIQVRTPTADPHVDNSSNHIGPFFDNDNNFTPFPVSNQQYWGTVEDPQGVLQRPGRPMKHLGGGRVTGIVNLVTNRINSFTLEGAATKSSITDAVGGTDAAEVTFPSGIYNSFTPSATDMPIWIEFDLKQGATSPATEIYMQVGLSGAANGNHFRRRYIPDASWRTYREQIVSASTASQLIKFKLTSEATGTKVQIGRVRVYHAYEPALSSLEMGSAVTTTTAPAAGGAGALPATPKGYADGYILGIGRVQIPYY